MHHYTTPQIATITAVPTVTVILLWTLAIFHKNRKHWHPYDIAIVAVLVQSILRNLSVLTYTILTIIQPYEFINEYCNGAIWLFNSLHTFQASTLSTLSVIGLYVINLHRKRKDIRQYLTSSHIIYHLFCLTALCACVGIAAILARHDETKSANFEYNKNITEYFTCQFMPYHLDVKYNIFILTLHSILALISGICFIMIVFKYYKYKKQSFGYLKKSTSDLSDLSLGAAASTVSQKDEMNKMYFDSYKKQGDYQRDNHVGPQWNSDTSNISTSVSSTNSRKPCLKKIKEDNRAGLESILPVLIVCYLFNHLPVIALNLYPTLIYPLSPPGLTLFLSLLQDSLLPPSLALVDSRFGRWVSRVYHCTRSTRSKQQEKLPHGLDGKFRAFSMTPQVEGVRRGEVKFPITNGSLYTSIDGHLPVVHNYRRNKGIRSPIHSVSMGLHSTYIKRQESILNQPAPPAPQEHPCDESFISLPADFTSLGSNLNEPELKPKLKPFSTSQISLNEISLIENELKKMKHLSRSTDNLNISPINIQRDIQNFKKNPEVYQKTVKKISSDNAESSDEEFCNHSILEQFDTISSKSCCSITTEANCDFDFYSKNIETTYNFTTPPSEEYIMCLSPTNSIHNIPQPVMRSFKPFALQKAEFNRNFKITRSNSKRSLDKLDSYIRNNKIIRYDSFNEKKIERSNSNRSYDNTKGTFIIRSNKEVNSFPDLSYRNCVHFNKNDMIKKTQPVLSVESLCSILNDKGVSYLDNGNVCNHNYGGSVPDFKKIFVSDYL